MAVEERRRSELFDGLVSALGHDEAATLFELLPPPGSELVTDDRLDALSAQVDRRFAQVDRRFEQVDRRFEHVDHRFELVEQRFQQMDQRFDQLEQRFDDRFAHLEQRIDDRIDGLRQELLAAFRGELVTAVSGQTRAVVVAAATATFGIGGLAVTLSQLL